MNTTKEKNIRIDDIEGLQDYSQEFEDDLNAAFLALLKDPSDKRQKEFEALQTALIGAWFVNYGSKLQQDMNDAMQRGIDYADAQLLAKKRIIKDTKITQDTYYQILESKNAEMLANLQRSSAIIQANARRVLGEINTATVITDLQAKKKISAQMAAELQEFGIAHIVDRGGKRWKITTYTDMLTQTMLANIQRQGILLRSLQYGEDLVRIVHLNIHPECELCIPFSGKVLSITGDTPGFYTIEQATDYGLFHPNCDHVEELELAPEVKEGDTEITLNEFNKKRAEYNAKRNMI